MPHQPAIIFLDFEGLEASVALFPFSSLVQSRSTEQYDFPLQFWEIGWMVFVFCLQVDNCAWSLGWTYQANKQ